MKKSITLLLLAYSFMAFSQNPYDEFFQQASLQPCPFDSTQTLLQFDSWEIYQTLNDQWDGTIDSSKCFEVNEYNTNNFEIDLSQVAPDRPLFIRNKLDDLNKIPLASDALYAVGLWHNITGNTQLSFALDCPGGFCSGMIVGVDIPDESGTGRALRINDAPLNLDYLNDFEYCMITEYFSDNFLREFVLQFSFDTIAPNSALRIGSVANQAVQEFGIIEEVAASSSYYNGTTYLVPLIDFTTGGFFSGNMVMLYDSMTYPSAMNPSYIKVSPSPNTSQQETMNLYVDLWQVLTPQPFTAFQGGLIEGSDSIRHLVNLINNGGTLCLSSIIDLVFDGGSRYVHQGGTVDFVNSFSCMQFLDGGILEVADDTDFHLGKNGVGVLALRQGGSIEIGSNSSLTIDAQLFMNESRGVSTPQQIYMSLNRGSRLTFTEHAQLSNYGSINGQMKLNIHMNGGILDDSQLSIEERALINKIYPAPGNSLAEDLELFPNPASDQCNVALILAEEETVSMEIFDIYGKTVHYTEEALSKGSQMIDFSTQTLSEGIYWVQVKSSTGQTTKKLSIHR